jgi:PAS domain S-box-containing protein
VALPTWEILHLSKRRFFYSSLIILLLIVAVVGWFATDYLGNKARQEIIGESRSSALTLSIYVSSTLNKFEEAVKSLAGSPWIAPALLSKGERDIEQANSALDRYNSALSASVSYLMDADGMTVASSNRNDPDSFAGKSYRFRPYFREAFRGHPYRYFALGVTSGKKGFYASYPVQNSLGKVVGVVTMKKDIEEIETFFSKYPFCFLISRDGIIFLSSTPAMDLKSFWPLDKAAREKLIVSQQFGNKLFEAVIEKEIADGADVTLEGNDYFVSRKVIDSEGWSIVLLTPIDRIRIYKSIGVLATISVCFLIVVFSGIIYVTDRSKEAIRQSEELYKTLAEKSMAGVYVVQDGNFLFINSNAASYAGYTREELLDQEAVLIVSPEDREKARQNARALLRGEESSPYEFRIITKQGATRWIMETVTSILHEGRPAILGNSMDITERKQAEEALREGEQRLHSIIDGSPIPAFVIGNDHRVIHWNKALEEMSRIRSEEIVGTCEQWKAFYNEERPSMADLLVDEAVELITQWYSGKYIKSQLIKDAYEATDFFPALGENGKWLRFTAAAIRDSKGMIVAAIETLEDITERKREEEEKRNLQERLNRAEKMESLGTLAGGVAHDLNNVLGVIVGYAELLLNSVDESSSIRPRLVKIMKGGERAAAIVQDLLTLARRGVPSKNVLNLNSIIADFQQLPEFEKLSSYHSSVRIKTDCDPELLNMSGSSVHLAKTLFNLVSNASESMTKGGIVTIKTANQYLDKPIQGYDEIREGDYVVLSVSDTGEGIPAADLKRIFEPFYTKKVMGRSGTGLGLAVVWGTVKDHHGYINIESKEGKGSAFTLYFPVTREDISAERIAVSISEYMGSGESILVVDDVKEQRDLAAEMLQTLNYNVTSVSSGEEAVAYLKEHQADLMVLDMIMDPGMDGLDTYRSILEIRPKQKAIIVSGFSESDRVHAAQALGTGAYVRKPYVIEKLVLAVRKELDRK